MDVFARDDEDALSLDAVLAAIDAWDVDVASLVVAESAAERIPANTTTKSPRGPNTQRHDVRQKRARKELREEIGTLKRLLKSEQVRVASERQQSGEGEGPLEQECRAILVRQRRARKEAEQLNEQLKSLIGLYHTEMGRFQRLIQRAAPIEGPIRPASPEALYEYRGPREDPYSQLRRLTSLKQEVPNMFASPTFDQHIDWSWEIGTRRDGKDAQATITMVYETSWMLPFDVDDVGRAIWMQTRRIMGFTYFIEWMDQHEDASSLVTQFVSRSVDPGCNLSKSGQLATRCEPLDDEAILFLSSVHAQVPDPSAEIAASKSDVWTLVQPVRRTPLGPLTRVLWRRRVCIQPPKLDSKTGIDVAQWANRIVCGSIREREERLLMSNIQAVENILVDAFRRKNAV